MWIGAMMVVVAGWVLWRGFGPNGEFPSRWPFPPADRNHPVLFWTSAMAIAAIGLVGLWMIGCGLLGVKPF